MGKVIMVVAPHPDDEVLGVGGTIARLASEGAEVHVVIITRGYPPLYTHERVLQTRADAEKAHSILGVRKTVYLDFPAAGLDTVSHREVNGRLLEIIDAVQPDIMFIPFSGDIHFDHTLTAQSCLVCARPNRKTNLSAVYMYETLSETNWNAPYVAPTFSPNFFVDITEYMDTKLSALASFSLQLRLRPHERSIEAVRALATLRGSTVFRPYAEAFLLVRQVF